MDKRIICRGLGVGLVVCVLIFVITSCSGNKEGKDFRYHILFGK